MKIPSFLQDGVKYCKYMCYGFLCCVCRGLVSLDSWLFLWILMYGLVQVLILSRVGDF
jgi:hypothetical protein